MFLFIRVSIGYTKIDSRKFKPFKFFENITVAEDILANLDIFHMDEIRIRHILGKEGALLEKDFVAFNRLYNWVSLPKDMV